MDIMHQEEIIMEEDRILGHRQLQMRLIEALIIKEDRQCKEWHQLMDSNNNHHQWSRLEKEEEEDINNSIKGSLLLDLMVMEWDLLHRLDLDRINHHRHHHIMEEYLKDHSIHSRMVKDKECHRHYRSPLVFLHHSLHRLCHLQVILLILDINRTNRVVNKDMVDKENELIVSPLRSSTFLVVASIAFVVLLMIRHFFSTDTFVIYNSFIQYGPINLITTWFGWQ